MHVCAGKQINLAEVKFAVASSLYSCHSIDDQLTSWYESSRAKREKICLNSKRGKYAKALLQLASEKKYI